MWKSVSFVLITHLEENRKRVVNSIRKAFKKLKSMLPQDKTQIRI